MATLKVGRRGFTLPVDMVTKTMGILAVKRSGKSNAAVVMAEEMYDAGVPWVAIDPKGDWWGIKAQGAHNAPGLPVIVFGGEHGDLPLEPTAGAYVADLIAQQRITCVLDVSDFHTKADQRRFLVDFATRLYKVNREPLHVFCEEADEYIPQKVGHDETKVVGAFETLVKRGGFRGIGITLVTQRSASLNKDVLTQVGTLFAMRTTGPQDRKAINDWVDWHDAGRDLVRELPKLANGEAYLFSPEDLHTVEKMHFRVRRTYDSGATPEVGKKIRPPKTLAEVDLDAIRLAMADTIEKFEANDPKHLQQRIHSLEREVAGLVETLDRYEQADTLREPEVKVVEVKVVDDETLAEIQHIAADQLISLHRVQSLLEEVQGVAGKVTVPPRQLSGRILADRAAARSREVHRPGCTGRHIGQEGDCEVLVGFKPVSSSGGIGEDLPGPQKKILTALAQHGPQKKTSLAILTGYSHKGGGFNNPLSNLRSSGYISAAKIDPIEITKAGLAALGSWEPLPTGRALLQWWLPQLSGPEQKIVAALDEYGPMEKNDLADATGYSSQGGGFNNPLSHLRTIGVLSKAGVTPISLAPEMSD